MANKVSLPNIYKTKIWVNSDLFGQLNKIREWVKKKREKEGLLLIQSHFLYERIVRIECLELVNKAF